MLLFQEESADAAPAAAVDDADAWADIVAGHWPFQRLCEELCLDLLHPCWEARHGASVALREILRTHAASAAVCAPLQSDQPSGLFLIYHTYIDPCRCASMLQFATGPACCVPFLRLGTGRWQRAAASGRGNAGGRSRCGWRKQGVAGGLHRAPALRPGAGPIWGLCL